MSQHPGFSAELLTLCGQMRDQTISDEQTQRLNRILAESKAARQFYLQFMAVTAGLESRQTNPLSNADDSASGTDVDLLLDLLRMEQDALAEVVCPDQADRVKPFSPKLSGKSQSNQPLSELLDSDLVLYVAGRAVRSQPAKWLAAAALVALGVLLAVQFIGPTAAPGPDPLATAPNEPGVLAPVLPEVTSPTVATLTKTNNAKWAPSAAGALAFGSPLHAGQRLTLTAGFAEITTNRGAIAILEAPCTVELIDNANAIRLHSGKMVGICETDASKGFLVRTPHMDVTDLGTRFGVQVDDQREAGVFVFEGSVTASQVGDQTNSLEPTLLAAGQGQRIDRSGQVSTFTGIDAAKAFAKTMDRSRLYESLVLGDEPLIYYRMDNVVDGLQRNAAGDRYHAKVYGDVLSKQEAGRSFLSLNAFGDYLQAQAPIAELRGAASYTLECWVRSNKYGFGSICSLNALNEQNRDLLNTSARLETTPERGVIGPEKRLRFVHSNTINHAQADGGPRRFTDIHSLKPHALNRWMHVAAVKSGPELRLYVDGLLVSEGEETTNLLDIDVRATIGQFSTEKEEQLARTRQFIGQIDELAIYDHALSPQAIKARFELGQQWEDAP